MEEQCQGPCLPHCFTCSPVVAALAYAALAYLGACVGYLVLTRHMGTPFLNSLSDCQRTIKARSAARRARAFQIALVLTVAALAVTRPLRRG